MKFIATYILFFVALSAIGQTDILEVNGQTDTLNLNEQKDTLKQNRQSDTLNLNEQRDTLELIEQRNTLELKVTNFEELKGQLIISIFDQPKGFPIRGNEMTRTIYKIENIEDTSVNILLPHGDFAIALLHDINGDSLCNFNFLGIPTEAYGFSQNVRPIFKAPSFEEAKFSISGSLTMKIELIK